MSVKAFVGVKMPAGSHMHRGIGAFCEVLLFVSLGEHSSQHETLSGDTPGLYFPRDPNPHLRMDDTMAFEIPPAFN
jgi:hypothetical protein